MINPLKKGFVYFNLNINFMEKINLALFGPLKLFVNGP